MFMKTEGELQLFYEGEQLDPGQVQYHLYEPNFITAMKFIFERALTQKIARLENDQGKDGQGNRNNILSFIGRRGAGKTTAMLELCRILKNIKDDDCKDQWIKKVVNEKTEQEELMRKRFFFHVLPPVDASLLSETDDFLEVIVVSIYQEYEEYCERHKDYEMDYERRYLRINQIFEELLSMYRSAPRKAAGWRDDYSFVAVKEMLHSSAMVAGRISELLDKLVELYGNPDRMEYFVIAVDDLDLNLSHGYQMLEQLQKYFCDSRILILLTMDYEQMKRVCAEYFHAAMVTTDQNDQKWGFQMHSQELANDVMTKVFPLQQRLFLPDMKKQGNRMRIQLEKSRNISIKHYVMEKTADRMRIFYDIRGNKRHFCEPDTVRKLVDYDMFLDSLLLVDYQKLTPMHTLGAMPEEDRERAIELNRNILRKYDQNHNRFNWDIMERQAQITLNSQQQRVFRQLLEFPLERRMMYFVHSGRDSDTQELRLADVSDENRSEYAYGDLLEKIYTWGRSEYRDKPFVSCVMASFTSEMVREYVNFRYLPDEDRWERSYKRLKAFLGISFSNNWVMKEKFPKCVKKINKNGKIKETGYLANVPINTLLYFSVENLSVTVRGINKGKVVGIGEWMKKNRIVEILECIDMFLSMGPEADYVGPEIIFELGTPTDVSAGTDEKFHKHIQVTFKGECTMDVLGLVGKSLDYKKHKGRLHDRITDELNKALKEYFTKKGIVYADDKMLSLIQEELPKYSIFNSYWDEELSTEAALPFYNLDLMYNVIKRIQPEKEPISEAKFYEWLLKLYQDIEDGLEQQGEVYQDVTMNYAEIFRKCPYICAMRAFYEQPEGASVVEQIESVLYNINDPDDLELPDDPLD